MTSTMLHSSPVHTPPQVASSSDYDYVSFRAHASFSPCRLNTLAATPPRNTAISPSYGSPILMLSPSPLRRHVGLNDLAINLNFPEGPDCKTSTPIKPRESEVAPTRNVGTPILFIKPDEFGDDEAVFFQSPSYKRSVAVETPNRTALRDLSPNIAQSQRSSVAQKRKVNLLTATPHLTPLRIQQPSNEKGEPQKLARLAPLPAPKFNRSPTATKSLKPESMLEMSIADTSIRSDRGTKCEEIDDSSIMITSNDKLHGNVVEFRSPGGHVTKRRAGIKSGSRGRMNPPSPSPSFNSSFTSDTSSFRRSHSRRSSSRSIKDFSKTMPERPKNEFNRVVSSATLFFGPAISNSDSSSAQNGHQKPFVTVTSPGNDGPPNTPSPNSIISDDSFDIFNRRSPDSSYISVLVGPNESSYAFSSIEDSPSIRKSPRPQIAKKYRKPRDSGVALADEDEGFPISNASSSYSMSGMDSTDVLQTPLENSFNGSTAKAGVIEDFDNSFVTPGFEPRKSSAWPTPVETSKTILDDFIVKTLIAGGSDAGGEKRIPNTPQKRMKASFLGAAPGDRPWASAMASKSTDFYSFGDKLNGPDFGIAQMDKDASVKKARYRPRKTCPEGLRFPSWMDQFYGQSGLNPEENQLELQDPLTDATENHNPSRVDTVRTRTYGTVGLGRPNGQASLRAQALMRRGSSGNFSGSSESSLGTPTKIRDLPLSEYVSLTQGTVGTQSPLEMHDSPMFNSPTLPRHPAWKSVRESRRRNVDSENGPSTSSILRQPNGLFSTVTEGCIPKEKVKSHHDIRSRFWNHHLKPPSRSEEAGRFETDFIEVDEIGAGEFGRALKVRYKTGFEKGDSLYAIKISKRFEGTKHRIRLLEEVDILRHLSAASGHLGHSNVLSYIDSWEQNEQLYILTELCEYGNFAHFLSEYGCHFMKLDEARVWKIFAELSNGLRFIHNAGVLHLDFKPANIFITAYGRFKIGDFGMASLWPRPTESNHELGLESHTAFEREGDKMYLAAEVLQGIYGKETDIFSFGMTMLETATNIVVPAQGQLWHRLRAEDFAPVEGFEEECSEELVGLIKSMMRKDPERRPDAEGVWSHAVIRRTRAKMEEVMGTIRERGDARPEVMFQGSALAGVEETFLDDILKEDKNDIAMEVCADFIEEKRNSQ